MSGVAVPGTVEKLREIERRAVEPDVEPGVVGKRVAIPRIGDGAVDKPPEPARMLKCDDEEDGHLEFPSKWDNPNQ